MSSTGPFVKCVHSMGESGTLRFAHVPRETCETRCDLADGGVMPNRPSHAGEQGRLIMCDEDVLNGQYRVPHLFERQATA